VKTVIEKIIRLRNPAFSFHEKVDGRMIASLISSLAIGHLRSYKFLLKGSMPIKSVVGRNAKTRFQHKIKWGKQMKIGESVLLSGLGTEGIIFGNNVSIGDFSRLIVSTTFNDLGKYIKIGNNVGMGEFAYLGGAGGLEIGDDCIIGQYLSCHPENHNFENNDELIRMQGTTRKGIKIGKNCWIGSKVTFLDGVEIGDGCVIAAGSVVNKSFASHSVIGGVPAKLLKQL
jgi:acetyltransferase-like isoleucine patch superfamily enzyme